MFTKVYKQKLQQLPGPIPPPPPRLYGYLYCTGTMLGGNKVLTSLGLRRCELGPGGLCVVLSAVGMNTTLTSLDLSENKFDDQSIASLGK